MFHLAIQVFWMSSRFNAEQVPSISSQGPIIGTSAGYNELTTNICLCFMHAVWIGQQMTEE